MYTKEIDLLKTGLVPRKVRGDLKRLFQFFAIDNKELFLVGGVVRDLLLGKKPKDYDLCTNATPEEAKEIVERYGFDTYDSGIKHGTITILDPRNDLSFELTTYRCDGLYKDSRHPESVEFVNSLEEDLKRRDFTINSFAYDLINKRIYALEDKYFTDMEFGLIRAVGSPEERFNEDALRMMRAIRFAAQLNYSIDAETFTAIKTCAPKIANISKERIRDELTKIVMSDSPQMMELLFLAGFDEYLDELKPIRAILECEHENPWHYTDVFHHTMDVIKQAPKTFEVRWAALLHDIGKPVVKKLKPGTENHYRYIGHPEVSVEIAQNLMHVLRFSNDQIDLISKFIKYHDEDLANCKIKNFKKAVNDIGLENMLNFIGLKRADALAHRIVKDEKFYVGNISKLYERYSKLITEKPPMTLKDLALNGDDLIELGYKGKEIGEMLNYWLDLVLERPEANTREYLLKHKKFKKNGGDANV